MARTLKFGVEVEFFGVNKWDVVRALIEKGLEADFESYNHITRPHWKVTTDGSVTCTGVEGDYTGLEIVSPILYGNEGLDQLETVLEVLNNLGAQVDKTCGIHIHHDISDYTVKNMKSIYNFYYNNKQAIDHIMPRSRRDKKYGYCRTISPANIQEINNAGSAEDIYNALGTRYKTLNIKSYLKYGTVEFRQHSGSTDPEKIVNWVITTFKMVDYCKNNVVNYRQANGGEPSLAIKGFIKKLDLTGAMVGDYLTNRFNHFAQSENRTEVAI